MKDILSLLAVGILLWGCSLVGESSSQSPEKIVLGDTTATEVIIGEVRYLELEGGFWAIVDDTTTYEPRNLPESFARKDLEVRVRAVFPDNQGSFRMVGPVIEIRSIEPR